MIDGKSFFDVLIKNKEETYEKIILMTGNNFYTTDYIISNLFDYDYFSNHYNLIATDLSKQNELVDADKMQQIYFIDSFEKDDEAIMFFITGKSEETSFNFSQSSVSII